MLSLTYETEQKQLETECVTLRQEIEVQEQQIEKEKEKITTFYLNITNAPAVSHALSNGQLELDQENLNYRCCLLTDALTTFANSFSQTILTFKNNVRKASHAFPEQYTSLKTDRDYFSEFKHSVKTIEKRLYGEIFMTAFEHSKPFLFYNDRGFINTLTYPAVLFPAECLRITHELIGKYFLSEDYILQYFHDKGIRFPISLAEFLSRVDIK